MSIAIQALPFKPPRLIGLSEPLLANHYQHHYGAMLRRYNAVATRLADRNWQTTADAEVRALQHEALQTANSITLHEAYFDSLGGADGLGSPTVAPSNSLADAIDRDFGSFNAWWQQFVVLAQSLADGGWVVLAWSQRLQRLHNYCTANAAQMPTQSVPVLALDMEEHAYQHDFGADIDAYIDAYQQNLHWDRPTERFAAAVTGQPLTADESESSDVITPEQLREQLASDDPPVLLDVCLADDTAQRYDILPGARFLEAEQLEQWINNVPRDRPLVVYCMYGFQVSGNATTELRQRGHQARRLTGGIAAWRAIGGTTEPIKP